MQRFTGTAAFGLKPVPGNNVNLELQGKVVLVTGGSHGLGRAICEVLAAEGARVGLNYRRSPERAENVVEGIQATGGQAVAVRGDVISEEDVVRMFDELETALGPVFGLVNNAAYCAEPPTVDLELDDFTRAVDVNLRGMFLCSRELIRRFKHNGLQGRIVNISSQAAFRGSNSGKSAYDMTKLGIVGYTRSLAREVAAQGVCVNCVAPGLMYTEMLAKAIDADPDHYARRAPLGRLGRTEEIAAVVTFLFSAQAGYMTGATVDVSGGLAMH